MKGRKMSGICIYGRGVKGIEAFFSLRDFGINVECIIDNDETKQGTVLAGGKCLSYKEFLKTGDKTSLVIVSNKKSKDIIHTLHKDGIQNVVTWTEYKERYEKSLPVLEDVDQAKFYLEKIKLSNWSEDVQKIPLLNNLMRDMEFRDGIKQKDASLRS